MKAALSREFRTESMNVVAEVVAGFASAIDDAAAAAPVSHRFLRRAWFEAAGNTGASTVIGRRPDGAIIAAIPLVPTGPSMLGVRTVPGSYWPFRCPPVAEDATADELRGLLSDDEVRRTLGPVWRLGPVHADDFGFSRLAEAAQACGWTMLQRRLGTSFAIDVPTLRSEGSWPRSSTMRKIRAQERQLAAQGPLRFRFVVGEAWDTPALDALAATEAKSWVATATDGSGAKFMKAERKAYWQQALRDPVIADRLSAAILFVGDTPAAFSFDLNAERLQYGIASCYDQAFGRWSAGKIVTWRHLEESIARGVERADWGSGDSGYKSQFGATAGSEIVDCLFVRGRPLAAMLRSRWTDAQPEAA